MKTSQLERLKAQYTRSARKVGMPLYLDECDWQNLAGMRRDSYWAGRLREYRDYKRSMAGADQLQIANPFARVKPSSRLHLSASLRQLLGDMNDNGDAVAEALLRANRYAHCHARKLAGNYFSFREKAGMISYLPTGRTLVTTEAGTWARDGRQEMKPAKWARAILPGWQLAKLKDPDFAAFAAKFAAAENASALRLELHEDVEAAYGAENYSEHVQGSCMQQDPVGPFYAEAGAKVLAIWRGDGQLDARALFWPEAYIGGRVVPAVDRVYGSPEHCEMIRAWARENGAAVKGSMTGRGTAWELNGEHLGYGGYVVPTGNVDRVKYFPYLDTFRYQTSDGELHANDDTEEVDYEYSCTSGCREERDRHVGQVQTDDGDWIDEDEACMVDGSWYLADECVMCERSQEYILRDGAYEVEISRNRTIYLSADYVTEL